LDGLWLHVGTPAALCPSPLPKLVQNRRPLADAIARKYAATAERTVVYFPGCAGTYYETRVGQAAVAVLEHNGWNVIYTRQDCCGMPALANHNPAAARRQYVANVRHLVGYARRGIPIVGTSVSCIHMLRSVAPTLHPMDDEATRTLSAHLFDIFTFLSMLHQQGQLRTDVVPIAHTLTYQPDCPHCPHTNWQTVQQVLGLVPGLRVVAGLSSSQHVDRLHPIELLAQAYGDTAI
ncbi:MAG: hypothetical protein HC893_15950, partial [Chloroflexaceae bacterium]|nr:hypothetical protein [Chloroflexaceae bacterium]